MQNRDELEEIDLLGEDEGEEEEEFAGLSSKSGGMSTVPLLQALACILLLAGLLYMRHTGHPAYGEIVERYRQEAAQELDLPRWEGRTVASPSPSPTPAPTEKPAALSGPEVQRL